MICLYCPLALCDILHTSVAWYQWGSYDYARYACVYPCVPFFQKRRQNEWSFM